MVGKGQQRGRRIVAVAVVGALCAALVACSGGDSGEQDGKGSAASGRRTAAPAALTEAQLKAAAFTDGETVGAYTASEYTLGAPHGDDYTADPAVCQPLVSLAEDVTAYRLKAEVSREAEIPDKKLGPTVAVQLRSYAGGDAARVMKAVGRDDPDAWWAAAGRLEKFAGTFAQLLDGITRRAAMSTR